MNHLPRSLYVCSAGVFAAALLLFRFLGRDAVGARNVARQLLPAEGLLTLVYRLAIVHHGDARRVRADVEDRDDEPLAMVRQLLHQALVTLGRALKGQP